MARALVLDFDGVMTDSDLATEQVWRAMFGWYGSIAGAELFDAKVHGWSLDDVHEALASVAGRPIDGETFEREWALVWSALVWNGLPVRAEAIDLLRAAKRAGWRTAIATNAQDWYVQRHLRTWRAEHLIGAVSAVSGSNMAKKPAPDVYLGAATQLDVDPRDAVAVDDSDGGIEAALAAGMVGIGLRTRWRSDTFVGARAVDQLSEVAATLGLLTP